MAFEVFNEDIYFGRPTQFDAIQDFAFDLNDFALKARKVLVADIGNPGQIFLRRAGPDNASFDSRPGQLTPNSNIGNIAWQARTASGWDGRNAQIYCRARGVQTPTSAGGSLHFATTPLSDADSWQGFAWPIDRMVIEPDGRLFFPDVFDGRIRVRDGTGAEGWIEIKRG